MLPICLYLIMGGKMKTKIFYTCGIGWQHDPDIKLFESADLLKARTSCWTECGIVEVEVTEKRWVEEQNLFQGHYTDPDLINKYTEPCEDEDEQ